MNGCKRVLLTLTAVSFCFFSLPLSSFASEEFGTTASSQGTPAPEVPENDGQPLPDGSTAPEKPGTREDSDGPGGKEPPQDLGTWDGSQSEDTEETGRGDKSREGPESPRYDQDKVKTSPSPEASKEEDSGEGAHDKNPGKQGPGGEDHTGTGVPGVSQNGGSGEPPLEQPLPSDLQKAPSVDAEEPADPSPNGNRDELELRTEHSVISSGESFEVQMSFARPVTGNAVCLTLSFDPEFASYEEFKPGEGITVADEEVSDGECILTLTSADYKISHLGAMVFSSKEAEEQSRGEYSFSLHAQYVVRDNEEDKEIREAYVEISVLQGESGDVNGDGSVNLLDLSDLTDHFGADESQEEWEQVKWFDLDDDGSIGIGDIAYLAKTIRETIT